MSEGRHELRGSVKPSVDVLLLAGTCVFGVMLWVPLLGSRWFDCHERDTYLLRTVEYLAGLRDGQLYPRWGGDMYGGYGSPFFVFYPPLVYAFAAFCMPLLGSVTAALKAEVLVATLLGGVSMYLLAREETRRPDAAVLAAMLFLCAPYRIWDLYGRGDLAEYTALSVLPLALYGYRRAAGEPVRRRAAWFASLAALAHAACVFCHTLLGFYGSVLLGACVLASALCTWRRGLGRQALLVVVGYGFALALSAAYTLPAALEQRLVRIDSMHADGYAPSNNLLPLERFEHWDHFFYLPVLVAGAVLLVGVSLWRRRISLRATAAIAFALLVCWLQRPQAASFWEWSPLLSIIQFPWRLLGLGWIALSLAFGLLWADAVRGSLLVRALCAGQLAWCAALVCWPLAQITPMPDAEVRYSVDVLRSSLGATTGLDEYLPARVPRTPREPARSIVAEQAGSRSDWEIDSNNRHVIALSLAEPCSVTLRLHHFPGWSVKHLEGRGAVKLTRTQDGYVALEFEQAGNHSVAVAFGDSPVRFCAGWLSILALLGLVPALHFVAGEGPQLVARVRSGIERARAAWRGARRPPTETASLETSR